MGMLDRFGGVFWLPVILAIIAFVLIGAPSSWLTLTVAGLFGLASRRLNRHLPGRRRPRATWGRARLEPIR